MGGIGSGPLPKGLNKTTKKPKRLSLPDGYPAEIEESFRWLVKQLDSHHISRVDIYGIADMAFYLWQKTEAMKLIDEGGWFFGKRFVALIRRWKTGHLSLALDGSRLVLTADGTRL